MREGFERSRVIREGESSPEESDILLRYVDLVSHAYDSTGAAENDAFTEKIIAVSRALEGEGFSVRFRESMRNNLMKLEQRRVCLRGARLKAEEFRRASLVGRFAPEVYADVNRFVSLAEESGVPAGVLQSVTDTVRESLDRMVRNRDERGAESAAGATV